MLANLTCPLTAPLAMPFVPPYFDIFPQSTVCGRDLFPNHLAFAEREIEWLGCSFPASWNANCYNYLNWANDNAMTEIFKEISKAHDVARHPHDSFKEIKDYAKFAAAMGYNWHNGRAAVELLPEIPVEKIHLMGEVYQFPNYLTVNAEDMTAPVMVGRYTPTYPNDGRLLVAIRVEDVQSGQIFAQTFHTRFADSVMIFNDWRTYGGVLVKKSGTILTDSHFELFAKLFNGQAIQTPEGRTLRLACNELKPSEPVLRRISPCDRITNLFSRAACWLRGDIPV